MDKKAAEEQRLFENRDSEDTPSRSAPSSDITQKKLIATRRSDDWLGGMRNHRLKRSERSSRDDDSKGQPGREHWWWQRSRLKGALNGNPQLDRLFYWKIKGRKSPDGTKWTTAQRRNIETALWLYELDARISRKYLFGKPAHLLSPGHLSSVVAFVRPANASSTTSGTRPRRSPFAWVWIEYLDKRNDARASRLTRAEVAGVIAAMKYCLEYFLRE